MRCYCTLFDINYLPNFLALYGSLRENDFSNFKLFAFCMDDSSFAYLSSGKTDSYPEVTLIDMSSLLEHFHSLRAIREMRSKVEFYFTCTPFICTYVLDKVPTCDIVTYLDADLYFFSSVDPLYNEFDGYSILIMPHNFYGYGKRLVKYGMYNVGWVSFRNDKIGNTCLYSWLKDCENWCFDYFDRIGDRFGDQKYLDKWEKEFNSVQVSKNIGSNLGPWNAGQYKIKKGEKSVLIDNTVLIFYHFASFKPYNSRSYTSNMSRFHARPSRVLKEHIYIPYLRELFKFQRIINDSPNFQGIEILKKDRPTVNISKRFINLKEIYSRVLKYIYDDFIFVK